MRVPVPSTQTDASNHSCPDLESNDISDNTFARDIGLQSFSNNQQLSYNEPTSVLDLRRSPICVKPSDQFSATAHKVSKTGDLVQLDEHVSHEVDWDSIMKGLGMQDESGNPMFNTSLQSYPHEVQLLDHLSEPSTDHETQRSAHNDFTLSDEFYSNQNLPYNVYNPLGHTSHYLQHHQNNLTNVEFDFIKEFVRAADCFESNELQLAHVILDRLNQRLLYSPTGKPLYRAGFHFKEALQSLLSGSNRTPRLSSWYEIVQNIRTYKAFSSISPILMFSHFTTNQALLEALTGSAIIHIVDFDIGLGGQYASLMKEIAEKAEACKTIPPVLRVTSIVPEEYAVESRLISENLTQFAQELNIRFQMEFVLTCTFESMWFKAMKFMSSEKTAVLLSPAIFQRLGDTSNVCAFLSELPRVSPSVVVFVDSEGWTEAPGTTSFRRNIVNGLEFYTIVLESLDSSMAGVGSGGEWIRRIETLLLKPKIFGAVEGAGRRVPPWREVFQRAGMRPVQLSKFADFQAECLLGKVQVSGFQVAKRQTELALCWQGRTVVATSAWRC